MSADGMPPGWVSLNGIVEAADAVGAYAARLQPIKGVCRGNGCFRRVELDPGELCAKGLARLSMRQVERWYRCQRLEGCGLEFHAERAGNPLRLEQFIGRPNVRVRVSCRGSGCRYFRVWRVEEMIAGLQKRKAGDGRTEVDKLGGLMSQPCPLCKKVNWTAAILWVSVDTMGWRQLGERSFDKVEKAGGV